MTHMKTSVEEIGEKGLCQVCLSSDFDETKKTKQSETNRWNRAMKAAEFIHNISKKIAKGPIGRFHNVSDRQSLTCSPH